MKHPAAAAAAASPDWIIPDPAAGGKSPADRLRILSLCISTMSLISSKPFRVLSPYIPPDAGVKSRLERVREAGSLRSGSA